MILYIWIHHILYAKINFIKMRLQYRGVGTDDLRKYFEDYVVGERRQTSGRTITETDIVLHAGQTGDFYPHHMDAEWCKAQPFGQRIAHGTLIFSMAVGMTAGEMNPRAMSYGY